jgi:hypothetical protein
LPTPGTPVTITLLPVMSFPPSQRYAQLWTFDYKKSIPIDV